MAVNDDDRLTNAEVRVRQTATWSYRLFEPVFCDEHQIAALRFKENGSVLRIDPFQSDLCECLKNKDIANRLAKKLNEGKE